ncbi:hydrolase [Streptomyces sp. NPDC050504]|uniref:hydrolase n=1 Tax=Streptomyces sp. NPDC050504 TaxID=3365618 RepID=UPI00379DB04C
MTMWTSLDPADVTVEPGSRTSSRLRVRNTGDTVEEYRLSLVGKPSGWGRIEPDVLRLYPGSEGTAEISFAPPRTSDAEAGPAAYGVRIEPRENAGARDVVEGQLTVAPFSEVRAEILPPTLIGRMRGRARIAVDNLGNTPLTASLVARDESNRLTFDLQPNAVQVAPGRAAFGELAVRPQDVRWTGNQETHRFTVAVRRSGDDTSLDLEATFEQKPVLGRWLVVVGGLLVTAAIAFAVLWFGFQPKVTSALKTTKPSGSAQPLPQGNDGPLPDGSLPPPPGDKGGDGDAPPPGELPPPPGELPPAPPPPADNNGGGDNDDGGGSDNNSGGGAKKGGGAAQPPAAKKPAPRPVGPDWDMNYQPSVVVYFAQLRLYYMDSKNPCQIKTNKFSVGVIDAETRRALVCYQDAVNRKDYGADIPDTERGKLGRHTLTSLWMQGVTSSVAKRNATNWEVTQFEAAYWWAYNKSYEPSDMVKLEGFAQEGVDHFLQKGSKARKYSATVAEHVGNYQRWVGIEPTGTLNSTTINRMLGGGVRE